MPRNHKTLPRLFVSDPLAAGAGLVLGREPSLYLAAVLRLDAGDRVVLFNGRDGAWLAALAGGNKKAVSLTVLERIAPQPPRADLWYGFAPLKSARLDYVVQKATEMGAGTIQPVLTRFTQQRRVDVARMRANAVEAAEQCEVLNVPDIAGPVDLDRLLAGWADLHPGRALVFADEAAPSASPLSVLQGLAGRPVGLLVGPEGGFADDERARLLAAPFAVPVSLGPRILRADTAAVAALAVIQATIGDWR